jgi:hypothetical protein
MLFLAYLPNEKGEEPVGGSDKTLFELKTIYGAWKRAKACFGPKVKLKKCLNSNHKYDESMWIEIPK